MGVQLQSASRAGLWLEMPKQPIHLSKRKVIKVYFISISPQRLLQHNTNYLIHAVVDAVDTYRHSIAHKAIL